MKKILLFSLSVVALMTSAQTMVSPYKPGLTTNGITYFLPHTQICITVTARKTTYTPGEYAKFAERFLRIPDATKETYDEWTLLDVKMQTYGVADKSQAYTIELNPKTSAPLVGLSKEGVLLSVNTEAPIIAPLPQPSMEKEKGKEVLNPNDFKTEEILSAGSTSKMAELTAEEIYDIREKRSQLSKGQADFMPKDGEQLKMMLAQLDKQEEGLLQLFKGSSSSEVHTFTFSYNPTKNTERDVLFRFSRFFGPVEADDLSGEPVYISIKDMLTLPAEAPADPKQKKKEIEDLRYIVPSQVNVKIFNDKSVFADANYAMAQFGRVEHLGGDLFNKKFTTKVTLFPETGGIKRIDGEPSESK